MTRSNLSAAGRRHCPGFTLPAVLVIVAALLILAVGILLVIGIERDTARSHVDHLRADLAARAALEDVTGILLKGTATDTYTILQSTREKPIQPGRQPAPHIFLAQGDATDGDTLKFRYLPLFSTTKPPLDQTRIEAPPLEDMVSEDESAHIDLATLPYLDSARLAWLPIRNDKGQIIARYAYWVEDLQSKLDPAVVGNTNGSGGAHADASYPFPAPGLNPISAKNPGGSPANPTATAAPLDRIALGTIDPAATTEKPGSLETVLVKARPLLLSPDAVLAAANIQPPLARDSYGHLTNPTARAAEENLITTTLPYLEQARVPFATGIDPAAAGKPKLNLNALLAKGSAGVDEMTAFVNTALPRFDTRKGGFPDDYIKTLSANAIDYADSDAKATLLAGSHRGIDAFPLLSEVMLQIRYLGAQKTDGRHLLTFEAKIFAELWNPTNQPASGSCQLSYEVGLALEAIGATTAFPRLDSPTWLDNSAKATHNLTKTAGRYWSPAQAISLKPDEYICKEFAAVTYRVDAGPSSISLGNPSLGLVEQEGAAGLSLRWNDQEIDRVAKLVRQKVTFTFNSPSYSARANVPALAVGAYGNQTDNLGDPRISLYIRDDATSDNAAPENTSPNRRNVRRSTIYDNDSARKPKTYGRVLPSEWPDSGHDSPIGTWTISKDDAIPPTDARYQWSQNPVAERAPQRLSQLDRFYSATELGRIFDPLMWIPTYDTTADTNTIRDGFMPASRFAWPDVANGSGLSLNQGGGNTLRIGRQEHPKFNQAGLRATHLLDLFHAGLPLSEKTEERTGPVVEIRGHLNPNTASRDALRALAAGVLGQDPILATVPASLSHAALPTAAPTATPVTLRAPATSNTSEADRIADAIILARPFASPAELAHVKGADGKPVFGNPDHYRPGIELPTGTRVQWTDSAAEEVFARVYEASSVRSRNFRVWVVGQALAPSSSGKGTPQVLAEVRKVFTLFADPGERLPDGSINPAKLHPRVIHERDF